jgi:hypothetical protein
MPKLLKDTSLSDGTKILISEYAEYPIDEYLDSKDISNKLTFHQILVHLIEVVEELHRLGFVH